jgi:hypothetical protein
MACPHCLSTSVLPDLKAMGKLGLGRGDLVFDTLPNESTIRGDFTGELEVVLRVLTGRFRSA